MINKKDIELFKQYLLLNNTNYLRVHQIKSYNEKYFIFILENEFSIKNNNTVLFGEGCKRLNYMDVYIIDIINKIKRKERKEKLKEIFND